MAQIFEISKYSDRYLIHHFKFESNESKSFGNIGTTTGHWTLNKFMSLHDWHQIFATLNVPIQQYIENPTKRPAQMQQHIGDTNFELNIAWIKMDVASIYPKLFTEIDFSLIFPYVIKVMVSLRSNIDKFNGTIDISNESLVPVANIAAVSANAMESAAIEISPNRKRTTPKRNVIIKLSPQEPPPSPPPAAAKIPNGVARKPIQLKECCVRLPLLQFDGNGQVIQEQQEQPQQHPVVRNNKRKHSSMTNDEKIHSIKMTPIRNGGGDGESSGSGAICAANDSDEFKFKCSSTPFIRNGFPVVEQNDGIDDSGSVKQKRRIPSAFQRLTISTPVSSQERKTGSSQFNPRIRLLKMPENVSKLNISGKKSKRKIRDTDKKATSKLNGKMKTGTGKRIIKKKKKQIRSVPNESQLFETPPQNRKQKKMVAGATHATTTVNESSAAAAAAASTSVIVTISPPSGIAITTTTPERVINDSEVVAITPSNDIVKTEDLDLKSLTDPELWESFDDNFELISNLFLNYLRQTDATVKTAGDYEPFDIISLMTTDQFSVMLDILFAKLVKIGEFGELHYDALFMKSLLPEWILSIFMQRNSFDRKTAIEKILSQKMQSDQNEEQYTSLINVRLDDTVNLTKM